MARRDAGGLDPVQQRRLPDLVRGAVPAVVDRQLHAGVDIIGDGEISKIGFSAYAKERLTGFTAGG